MLLEHPFALCIVFFGVMAVMFFLGTCVGSDKRQKLNIENTKLMLKIEALQFNIDLLEVEVKNQFEMPQVYEKIKP